MELQSLRNRNFIPDEYNSDSWFATPTYIGAVSGATDTWYKNWTLSGTIEVIRLI